MKATMPDGTILEGTPEEVEEYLKAVSGKSPTEYYNSKTKGWIKISEMNSSHIRNAFLKLYREWLDSAPSWRMAIKPDPKTFVRYIANGFANITALAMLKELKSRD